MAELTRPLMYFRFNTCSHKQEPCLPEHGKVQVKAGDTRNDNLCRCLWEAGYVPSRRMPQCLSLDGFMGDIHCYCIRKDCPAGQRFNQGRG